MDCRDVIDELYLYLDRELTPEETRHIEEHLNACSPCFELVRFESGVSKLIKRDCGSERAPERLKERLAAIPHGPE
jgi:mycothiol system anti-sigma-R factor